MPSTMILVCVSNSHNKCTLVPLDVLPSPLSSCLQKQEIIQNDPANRNPSWFQRWRCGHPKARSACQPNGSPHFHGLLPMQSFSGDQPDIDCVWFKAPSFYIACLPMQSLSGGKPDIYCTGVMANSIFLQGKRRKRVWMACCQTIPPPTTKGRVFGVRPRDPSPSGG